MIDKTKHLIIVRKITKLLETEFSIWKFKFGFDPIIGLVPGIGDIISAILSFYIIFIAIVHHISFKIIVHMVLNIIFDLIVGSIPLIGDVFDFVLKPNVKNLAILEKEINENQTPVVIESLNR
ncbi:MAG: DUF4112 domain-containing protein [Microgenomates group bacterium]